MEKRVRWASMFVMAVGLGLGACGVDEPQGGESARGKADNDAEALAAVTGAWIECLDAECKSLGAHGLLFAPEEGGSFFYDLAERAGGWCRRVRRVFEVHRDEVGFGDEEQKMRWFALEWLDENRLRLTLDEVLVLQRNEIGKVSDCP